VKQRVAPVPANQLITGVFDEVILAPQPNGFAEVQFTLGCKVGSTSTVRVANAGRSRGGGRAHSAGHEVVDGDHSHN
jgi:hypothetical protein